MQSAKQLVRIGIVYLEEAVLDVLFQAMENKDDPFVPAANISRKIGVGDWDKHRWLVAVVLEKLFAEGRIEPRIIGTQRRGWKLTETEYNQRTS